MIWVLLVAIMVLQSRRVEVHPIFSLPILVWGFREFTRFLNGAFERIHIVFAATQASFFILFFVYIFGIAVTAALGVFIIPIRILSRIDIKISFSATVGFWKKVFKLVLAWFGKWL